MMGTVLTEAMVSGGAALAPSHPSPHQFQTDVLDPDLGVGHDLAEGLMFSVGDDGENFYRLIP